MGAIYVATHHMLEHRVAIKVPHQPLGGLETEALERFKREGKILARLKHPNVVKVYDAGIENGLAFLVMEFIEGRNIEKRLETAPPTLTQVVKWHVDLADALSYIHAKEVIHRDIKCANIIITNEGIPILVDFGIARSDTLANVTANTFSIAGTIRYLSPELLGGDPPGPRSDIYGLGVVLYRCLTNHYPFDGPSQAAIIAAIARGQYAPAHHHNGQIPRWLSDVIDTCLKKDPEARYDSGFALRDALCQGLEREGVRDAPAPGHAAGSTNSTLGISVLFQQDTVVVDPVEDTGGIRKAGTPRRGRPDPGGFVDKVWRRITQTREPLIARLEPWAVYIAALAIPVLLGIVLIALLQGRTTPEPEADPPERGATATPAPVIPGPIRRVMEAASSDEVYDLLQGYRTGAMLTFGADRSGFQHPGDCYIVVYEEGGVIAVLSPERPDGGRTELYSSQEISGDVEHTYAGYDLYWVLLL